MTLDLYFDYVIFPLLTVSVILVFYRLFKGPEVVDRVIALDLIITIGIGFITAYSIRSEQALFLDVAMILALIAFLGTIAFAFYLDKKK
ncbi:multisubunit sodium/proton antiporter MrpF subunit [Arcticibacter pallidicorallinus]|uniref:Multisubunit sodium/proton antiporter MrpF subunit n=1 Tax=Arcticibacter pallidicorallinus TaxID=1259464 RepID=A0A2T0U5J8_9SPHI|nr:monovalent cation/H+ antiporter complex subunit F [Arcticibacter pallidicorallinus]PRY53164.1 multisubunit sodium/proton antiporter MrpF subunit [Arcticibacter pallidicorallinus]